MDPVAEIPDLLPLWQSVSGGDPAVRIAIIDGPVDVAHPALQGARASFDRTTLDAHTVRSEHGTHVTSVILGQPGSAVLGVAPNCTAKVYSIYQEGPGGELLPASQATLALAINRAQCDGADIINISSGQQVPTGQAQRILADAVRSCVRAGTLIVAAAGNDGCRCLQVPAACESVLAVGACDQDGRPLAFSNFGALYRQNGILAPGEAVKGAAPLAQVALRPGTSFATPIVSGVAALLLSRLRQSGRDADPYAVRAALLASASPCLADAGGDERCLAGQLDIAGAVATLFGADSEAPDASRSRAASIAISPGVLPIGTSHAVRPSVATGEIDMEESATIAAPAPHVSAQEGHAPAGMAAAVMPSEAAGGPVPGVAPDASAAIAAPAPAPAARMPSVARVAAPSLVRPQGVVPAYQMPILATETLPPVQAVPDCGCTARPVPAPGLAGQMAFPIGRLYYDFGTEARLDYFVQTIASWRDSLGGRGDDDAGRQAVQEYGPDRDPSGDVAAPYNPEVMVRYLLNQPPGEKQRPPGADPNGQDANAVIWTLTIDAVPIYAIKPLDVFGLGFYASLMTALFLQEVSPFPPNDPRSVRPRVRRPKGPDDGPPPAVTRVSFAGWLDGATTRLLNGTVLPTLTTDWRGFYQWNLNQLLGDDRPAEAEDFLERIYNEFRNVGISPQDRALNYSAMNAHNTKAIFREMAGAGKRLDTVEVDRSVICRPDSDCWDVTYRFFDPSNVLTQARQVFQYTIDVSDTVPVAVGPLRRWRVY
jgi:hypothetical protein